MPRFFCHSYALSRRWSNFRPDLFLITKNTFSAVLIQTFSSYIALTHLFTKLLEIKSLHLINDAKSVDFHFQDNSAMTTFAKWWSNRMTFYGNFDSSHYLPSGIRRLLKLVIEATQVKRSGKWSFRSTPFSRNVETPSVIRNTLKRHYFENGWFWVFPEGNPLRGCFFELWLDAGLPVLSSSFVSG